MAEVERTLTNDELIALVDNNTNVVGQILNSAKKQKHYLIVTLLREQVVNNLLPARALSKEKKQNRIRRYIRHIYENHFGENGEVFATNSTKELYDEMLALVTRRINDLKERKRSQGKASNESTTAEVAQPIQERVEQRVGQRRKASSSPRSNSNSDELNGIALLLGDMNINRQRRQRRAVRPRVQEPQQPTARQQAAQRAAQERLQQEEAARGQKEAACDSGEGAQVPPQHR